MPQDAFNLRRCAGELNAYLSGGKINRIIQPLKDEVVFNVYTGKAVLKLALSASAAYARACITKDEKEAPAAAPNFCMLLRKHLLGGEILSVEQVNFERIIAIKIKCVSDFTSAERVLYAEVMGKYSNLILTENGVILGALKTAALEDNCSRLTLAGAKYTLPKAQDKLNPMEGAEKIGELLKGAEGDIPAFIFNNISGIAISTARQITDCHDGITPLGKHIYSFLFEGKSRPCVLMQGGAPVEFSAKALNGAVPFDTVNEAQDYYFSFKQNAESFSSGRRKLRSAAAGALKKQEKKLALLLERKRECAGMEDNKLKGELITAYMYALKAGMDGCALKNYYDPNGKEVKIALDAALTPAQNAQRYYKKYNKQKRTLAAVEPQIERENEEIDYLNGVLAFIDGAESPTDLLEIEEELTGLSLIKPQQQTKKKKEVVTPFREFECDGFTILSGRNNLQNDRLLKTLSPADIWLHTQKYHSTHVGIITGGKEVPDEVLLRAAQICAYYSDAKGGAKVPVDYCARKYVKKPPHTRAGFVIYTDYKTILVEGKL